MLKTRLRKYLSSGWYFMFTTNIVPYLWGNIIGILTGGQGTRWLFRFFFFFHFTAIAEAWEYSFILADTEQLHEKIYEMSNRIRQLEDALAILQSSVSDLRHPLLSDELLKVKFGSESINTRETATSDEDHAPQKAIDALGTLSLGSSGKLQYLGRSAGSEVGVLFYSS